MKGYLSLILHAHLPFVRHPEHERFLEESWLFEAITETYVPLLQILERWRRDGIGARICLTLSPTLCAMLADPLLQGRYARHLDELIELTEKEVFRTTWEKPTQELALFYRERFHGLREFYRAVGADLLSAFRHAQDVGQLEILTSAATHALLPLLGHEPSLRAQLFVARDHYRTCFGREPRGIWLPECAYVAGLEAVVQEAGLRWFVVDSHGILRAQPRPRYALFAPLLTPNGPAVFGRDPESAKQVWSRHEGYPGDPRYRDFYRDVGFDLDLEYLKPYLPVAGQRTFLGLKYYRITGSGATKAIYDRNAALQAAAEHAAHFLAARQAQLGQLAPVLGRPPILVAPYDAELFGHWWYEGPEFLDYVVRKTWFDQQDVALVTPEDYLREYPTQQVALPAASSWGEEGYWRVWLNESNEWIYPHLRIAQERMTELARMFSGTEQGSAASVLQQRALKQAARELMLAQSSDWPFILRTGTSPDYARKRVTDHVLAFTQIYDGLKSGTVDEVSLSAMEARNNIFPELEWRYWC